MASIRIHLLSAVLCCLAVLGQSDEVIQPKTEIVPVAPRKNTTTTTSSPPNTTTTTTTSPAPPITTTPAPAPPGPLELGTWSFKNTTNNETCIVVQFTAHLNVTYNKYVDNKTMLAHAILNVPTNALVVDGRCWETDQWIQISWPNDTCIHSLYLQFTKNDSTHDYYLRNFNVSLTPDSHFPNATSNATMQLYYHSTAEWVVPLESSYKCGPPSQLNMTEASGAVATLTLARLQEQAFRTANDDAFSAARECGGGEGRDAVPIAVGCALGGLVVVVLVAYLVGRRRSAARGYLSM